MTRTVLLALVGWIVGWLIYQFTAPVLVTLSALLGGIGLIDPGVTLAFQGIVFGPWVIMAAVVIGLTVAEVRDALAGA